LLCASWKLTAIAMSFSVSTICPPVKSMSPAFQLSPLAFARWLPRAACAE
jgi:hypothetical protein